MRTIFDQWSEFERRILSESAGPVQRMEMRRSFYAGAQSMLNELKELGDADVSDDAGMGVLEGYQDELLAFGFEIAAGRA
jgi:hypothetical protein